MRLPSSKLPPRKGMTLLEVIVATAIFVGGMAILGQLLQFGLMASRANQRKTIALLRAESKMEELASGMLLLEAMDEPIPFEDDWSWTWSIAVEPTPIQGLMLVALRVEHRENEEDEAADVDFELSRLIVDPQWRLPPELGPAEGLAPTPITVPEMLGLPASTQTARRDSPG
jgi:prepilin-type N-terminal cleavage/methylation domain-containing protein